MNRFSHRMVQAPSLLVRSAAASRRMRAVGMGHPLVAGAQAAVAASQAALLPTLLHQHVQVANHWQAVIRRNRTDPKTGQPTFQDWDDLMANFQTPKLATTGQSLLERHQRAERHIKPKEVRRQINSAKIYKRSVKRVDDLVSYIQFMHEKKKDGDGDVF
jgi:hypothetical protein